ncbi:N-acetylglutamate kinase [mine drainage metagenome]|uniref:N-acetylglutamate kinase n=1 Tax=mine drainage metagenome TaxID=410659 RepID=T1CIJ2_9ZZZZ
MTLVVKVGGAAGNRLAPVLDDLAPRRDYVLVHGGSDEVDRLGSALGRPAEYYTSPSGVTSRKSTPTHLETVVLALAGKVQTTIVREFAVRGVRAVGLSGGHGGLLLARRKEGARAVVDGRILRVVDDWSGSIERADPTLLRALLGAGYVPVVGPPAATAGGELVNVDADRAAAAVAVALGATDLLLLTNVPGLCRDPADPSSLLRRVARDEVETVLPYAAGRMRKKVVAAQEALRGGVGRVVIGATVGPDPVARALAGEGTVFA